MNNTWEPNKDTKDTIDPELRMKTFLHEDSQGWQKNC